MISPFDPLFFDPLLTGMAYAAALPLIGLYLRLRDEWLAALAFAQVSAFGALLALLFTAPPVAGGVAAASLAAVAKQLFEGRGRKTRGTVYALLFLFGWGASVLLVVNLPIAERAARALFDGQLYFTGRAHLVNAIALTFILVIFLRFVSRKLLLAHFFPNSFLSRSDSWGISEKRAGRFFDLATAISLAFATMSIGVMAAFALLFIPPLIAFEWGANWRHATGISAIAGITAHLAAFVLALALDQPYGPLLGILLILMALLSALARCGKKSRRTRPKPEAGH
jgi:zinc transport system permease protein